MTYAPEIVISSPVTSSDAQPSAQDHVVWLDSLPLSHAVVGYGALGMRGSLGYENKQVIVEGRHYPHALSAHPPAALIFRPGGRFSVFTCTVALNDDVPQGRSLADFSVLADGQLVAFASRVVAGAQPQPLRADIRGAQQMELRVRTDRWEFCHAVWFDPQSIEAGAESGIDKVIQDFSGFCNRAKCRFCNLLCGFIKWTYIEVFSDQCRMTTASAGLIIRFPFNFLVMHSEQQRDIFRNKSGNIV
jgi:NPCBM/NEW2 domain